MKAEMKTVKIRLDLVSAMVADVLFGKSAPTAFASFLAKEVKQTARKRATSFCLKVKHTRRA